MYQSPNDDHGYDISDYRDVSNAISKVPGLPDAPSASEDGLAWGGSLFLNGPRVHEYLREMNEQVLSRYDIMTVGETLSVTPGEALQYAATAPNSTWRSSLN